MTISATAPGFSTAQNALQNSAITQPDKMKGADKAAKDFEGVFISEMLSHMFEGQKTDPEFGGGEGEDMVKSMLTNEYGKKMAEGNGIGLSGAIKDMMIKMQQTADGRAQ